MIEIPVQLVNAESLILVTIGKVKELKTPIFLKAVEPIVVATGKEILLRA